MHVAAAIGAIFVAFLALGILAVYIGSIVWAYNDAESRGKAGCLVAILVAFLTWPLGLVAWLVFRPNEPETERVRTAFIPCRCGNRIPVQQRMAGMKITCSSCGAEVAVPELSQLKRILAEEGFWAMR